MLASATAATKSGNDIYDEHARNKELFRFNVGRLKKLADRGKTARRNKQARARKASRILSVQLVCFWGQFDPKCSCTWLQSHAVPAAVTPTKIAKKKGRWWEGERGRKTNDGETDVCRGNTAAGNSSQQLDGKSKSSRNFRSHSTSGNPS